MRRGSGDADPLRAAFFSATSANFSASFANPSALCRKKLFRTPHEP
jgi:hypothetical protein